MLGRSVVSNSLRFFVFFFFKFGLHYRKVGLWRAKGKRMPWRITEEKRRQ